VSGPSGLGETIRRHSQVLFGVEVPASALQITPLSLSARSIYRVEARGRRPAVIAKLRSFSTIEEREKVAIQTSHEFGVLSAIWEGLRANGMPRHDVPQPRLVLPESGLLFMTQAEGEPVARLLWRWVLGLSSIREASQQLMRCGEWLRTYSSLGSGIAWPEAAPRHEAILSAGRSRHHVYSLIGLRGDDLVNTMSAGIRRRLTVWRVDPEMIRRIEGAFSRQFIDFAQARDIQGPVHGKYSIADVLTMGDRVSAVDLEQAGQGSLYLDVAYFLSQMYMVTRWRPFASDKKPAAQLRRSFLKGRSPLGDVDEALVDSFIAYYLVNSLRPGGGVAGIRARSYAARWLADWLQRVED
jgi:hypothetical protein